MSFVTSPTGTFFIGDAKLDYQPSTLPPSQKLTALEVNEIRDALFSLRTQFSSGTELPLKVTGDIEVLDHATAGIIMMDPIGVRWRITVNVSGNLVTAPA
jgi:hypothetical protein